MVAESIGLAHSAARLDDQIDHLKVKVKKLEEDMTSLREQDVMGAFNLIKENSALAKQYQQEVKLFSPEMVAHRVRPNGSGIEPDGEFVRLARLHF